MACSLRLYLTEMKFLKSVCGAWEWSKSQKAIFCQLLVKGEKYTNGYFLNIQSKGGNDEKVIIFGIVNLI